MSDLVFNPEYIFSHAVVIKSIIAWKALGRDCTNNNGLILQIGVLSSQIINAGLCHTVFAGIRYLGMYIYTLYIQTSILKI